MGKSIVGDLRRIVDEINQKDDNGEAWSYAIQELKLLKRPFHEDKTHFSLEVWGGHRKPSTPEPPRGDYTIYLEGDEWKLKENGT